MLALRAACGSGASLRLPWTSIPRATASGSGQRRAERGIARAFLNRRGRPCSRAMTDALAAPARPEPELVTAEGPWGGPVYRHRGAEIRCNKGGHVCGLFMEGHPL